MSKQSVTPKADEISPESKCGIIMPISGKDTYSDRHWREVKMIIEEAIKLTPFNPSLVSMADDTRAIQKTIVENIYKNPIVVCDLSSRNPNVMFELGLRLAFDKPVVLIKDSSTEYVFDVAPIEHIPYPRDLNFHAIVEFKDLLAKKIVATEKASRDKSNKSFLKEYGDFYEVAKLDTKEVGALDYILTEIKGIKRQISANRYQEIEYPESDRVSRYLTFAIPPEAADSREDVIAAFDMLKYTQVCSEVLNQSGKWWVEVTHSPHVSPSLIIKEVKGIFPNALFYAGPLKNVL